jgi:hypothetical protein
MKALNLLVNENRIGVSQAEANHPRHDGGGGCEH